MLYSVNTKDWTYTKGLLEEPVPEKAFRERYGTTAGNFDNPIHSDFPEGLIYFDHRRFVYILPPQKVTLANYEEDYEEEAYTHISPDIIVVGETDQYGNIDPSELYFGWLQNGQVFPLPYSNMYRPDTVRLRNGERITNLSRMCWGDTYISDQQCTLSQIGNLVRSIFAGEPNDDLENEVASTFEIAPDVEFKESIQHQAIIHTFEGITKLPEGDDRIPAATDRLYHNYLDFCRNIKDCIAMGDIELNHNENGYTYRYLDYLYDIFGQALDKTDDEAKQFRIASRFWQRIARVAKDLGEDVDSQATCLKLKA